MLKEERHQAILEILRRDGKVSAVDLGPTLGVSVDTVRRDLDELAALSALRRVHGGALPRLPIMPFDARDRAVDQGKAAIAELAVGMLHDEQVIVMDSGTTVLAVARRLPPDLRATVITTSIPVAAVLIHHPTVRVHLTGGLLNKEAQALVGGPAVEALRGIHADLCLLGICSLHAEIGVSVSDPEEAEVKRTMTRHAALVVALAGVEKIGTAEPYIVCPVGALTHLITDSSVPDHVLAPYQVLGLSVARA